MIPKIYIPICDDNLWLLKPLGHLFDKYWPKDTEIIVMGFAKPDFAISEKITFVSLSEKQEGGSSKWTKYLYNYLSTVEDEYLIFSLEDFFPIEAPDLTLINYLYSLMKEEKIIGRADLTWDLFANGNFSTVKYGEEYSLIKASRNAMYRISTQPAIWKKSYLLTFLNNDWSPWNFEVDGSEKSFNMPEEVIAIGDKTFKKFPTKWIHKGAHSRYNHDKINVLGLKVDTIKEMVDLGFFKEEQLQWGQWNGRVPTFHELGGYNFDPRRMPLHPASPSNWQEYYPIYIKE
jgi:hypothetical protein